MASVEAFLVLRVRVLDGREVAVDLHPALRIDGDFPTVKNPNPEYKEGFTLAIELAKQNDVDLIIGTDPDSDRTGIVLKDKSGEYVTLSGNQVGVLLTDYIITAKKLTNTMPAHPAVLKSIVTTEMARAAAERTALSASTPSPASSSLPRRSSSSSRTARTSTFSHSRSPTATCAAIMPATRMPLPLPC